jgi:hypothetical protein
MSLDKAIASGKEYRKPYRKSKRFDATCRNHGSCAWCRGNRTHKTKRQEQEAQRMETEITQMEAALAGLRGERNITDEKGRPMTYWGGTP